MDVLALDGAAGWNIELKLQPDRPDWSVGPEEMVERVLHAVDAAGAADRVTLQSFDWRAPRHVRRIRPERAVEYSGLYQFGPFRADKVPVVFVHGLNSDPSIWENATAAIMADPDLGKRCQFWYFFYPTGSAVTASSTRLREALDRQRKFYDADGRVPNMDRLILVGHSMGGLLSHLQVVEPGTTLYDAYFAVPPERLDVPESFRQEIRRDLFFSARRDVARVVFVCTPHRGSHLANWGLVRFLSRLVAVPRRLLDVSTQILTLNTDLLSPEMRRSGLRGLSSIDSLSPRNPYYPALEKMPITRPFDTILGDRGRGDSPHSSDGIVGYWSAHWDGARAETVVPYGHQCAMRPEVFDRLHAIVRGEVLGNGQRSAAAPASTSADRKSARAVSSSGRSRSSGSAHPPQPSARRGQGVPGSP